MLRVLRWGMLAGLALLGGCATTLRDPVPPQLVESASIPRMAQVRTWGDSGAPQIAEFLKTEAPQIKARYADRAGTRKHQTSDILALSGGGDDGAFGAGLLVGWTAHGTRPQFDLVTGISAGALIAPFAFLGPDYDQALAGVFSHGGGEIYEANILGGILGGSAVANSAPLAALIAKYVDHKMLRRIAEERSKGRFLLVGTTNLDAQRPVYWDMGRIAQSNNEQGLELFRKVLLASASLPGIFPPVHISVTADGKTFEEMHVDGGPTRQVFLTPTDFDFRSIDKIVGRRISRRLWVVRNGKVDPEYSSVSDSALAIAGRSIETLTKNQGIGDLVRMHAKAKAEGMDYNLAYIPRDFSAPHPKPFDQRYMRALYERGRAMGAAGYAWAKAPPSIDAAAYRP